MRGIIFGNDTYEVYPLPHRMMDMFDTRWEKARHVRHKVGEG